MLRLRLVRRIVLTVMGFPAHIAGNSPAGINMAAASWTNALPVPVVPGTNDLATNSIMNSHQYYGLSHP